MAKKTNVTSTFRIVAIVSAVLLLAAAALTYLRSGGGGSPTAEIAALSQAIPAEARAALHIHSCRSVVRPAESGLEILLGQPHISRIGTRTARGGACRIACGAGARIKI